MIDGRDGDRAAEGPPSADDNSSRRSDMGKRGFLTLIIAAALSSVAAPAFAQDSVKIGLILPMTGPFASTGRQIDTAVKVYMAKHGSMAGGKKIEVIVRDDAGTADTTRRLAQEL